LAIVFNEFNSASGRRMEIVFTEGRNTVGTGYPNLDTRGFVIKINRLFRL